MEKTPIHFDLFGDSISNKKPISRDILSQQLFNNLNSISIHGLAQLLTNEFNEIIAYVDLSHGEKTCQKTSLLFNPHRLSTKTKNSKISIYEAMKNESFTSGLARAVLFKKGHVHELLYQVLQLGINGVQYVNEFPPHVARDICKEHGVLETDKVLDPCGGWGGRMLGVSVACNSYECFEPCSVTAEGLRKLADFIVSMNTNFKAIVSETPFEDAQLKHDYYDFALTSPPYYDTEIYSDENTNSLNRYKTFEQWCNGFYLPLIKKTMDAMKPKKPFILNIGSRTYPLNRVLIHNFKNAYQIEKRKSYLSGRGGLGRTAEKEGEAFYVITK